MRTVNVVNARGSLVARTVDSKARDTLLTCPTPAEAREQQQRVAAMTHIYSGKAFTGDPADMKAPPVSLASVQGLSDEDFENFVNDERKRRARDRGEIIDRRPTQAEIEAARRASDAYSGSLALRQQRDATNAAVRSMNQANAAFWNRK